MAVHFRGDEILSSRFIRHNQQGPISPAAQMLYLRLLNREGLPVTLENPDYAVPIQVDGRPVPHTPDIMNEDILLPVEVDGPHHLKPRYEIRDKTQVNFAYLEAGYRWPCRIPYDGNRPSNKKLDEWVSEVKYHRQLPPAINVWEL